MLEEFWDRFVMYVNAYYAIQEAQDSSLRMGQQPPLGLKEFCRDANPFLWDERSSAEPSVYEDYCRAFDERFEASECTAQDGLDFSRAWLSTMEGELYGSELVSSLDSITDLGSWMDACDAIARQVAMRAAYLERSPQDDGSLLDTYDALEEARLSVDQASEPEPEALPEPSPADVEAVIALLAKGDEAFAASLRARLADE